MQPRPYQEEAIEATIREFRTVDSTLCVMPTGTGKTVLFSHLADRWEDRRVLMVAHREELIFQMAQTVEAVTGDRPAIEMADLRSDEGGGFFSKPKVVVGSVQSLCRQSRLDKFRPDEFGLFVCDEAHHDTPQNATYLAISRHFGSAKKLGVTATPDRADKLALKQSYKSVAYQLELPDAISQGWLVPIRQRFVQVAGLDFSHVRTTAGDLNQGDLDRVLGEPQKCHEVAAAVAELSAGRKTLVFCVSVAHTRLVADILNRVPGVKAEALTGEDDRHRRREVLSRYRAGEINVLVGCAIFTEGFDEPSIEVVFIARPTKSRALYTQMVGRGTRTLKGLLDQLNHAPIETRLEAIATSGKPFVEVIDFVGNSGQHRLVMCADLLGGRYAPAAVLRAAENARKKGGASDVSAELAAAAQALDREEAERKRLEAEARIRVEQFRQRQEEERRKGLYGKATIHAQDVDPYGGEYVTTPQAGFSRGRGLTEKQRAILVKQGYDPNTMSEAKARQTLNDLFAAWKGQGITPKQKETLARFGESGQISKDKAAVLFAVLKARGWRRRDYPLTRDKLVVKVLGPGQYAPAIKDPSAGVVVVEGVKFGSVDGARSFLAGIVETPTAA